MLMENAARHTKDVIIYMLRQYFRNPKNYKRKLPPNFPEDCFKNIDFYATEPEELRTFPTVILTSSAGQMVTAGLGDMCSEIRDPRTSTIVAYRYQGFYEFSVQIDIGCKSPTEKEILTDFIAKAIRFDLRRFIQTNGILIKNVSYQGESTIDYNSDKIYISQLRIETFSTWVEDRELLDPNEINVKVTLGMVDQDTQTTIENTGTKP